MNRATYLRTALALFILPATAAIAQEALQTTGGLHIIRPDGQTAGVCPLKHTDVTADIAGYLGRVTVTQVFHNPSDQKIEAVYVFPLPEDAAVDHMVMTIGDRRVVGQIKEREEARAVYEAARAAGHVAGLLDQERPNIFTQSVANIEPGVEVTIEIQYVETLKYEDGVFEWVFPMVVGPRYIPGGGSAPAPGTTGNNTPEVPDGAHITPPVTPPNTRAGHDVSLAAHILSSTRLPVQNVQSKLHAVEITQPRADECTIKLAKQDEIPNRDFVLRYQLGDGNGVGDAFMVHEDERGKFFTLILQPPRRTVPAQLVPRELVFVMDSSGSMGGFPIAKAKELMNRMIGTMRDEDTFNIITFAGHTNILWQQPRPATAENISAAQKFISGQQGGGGTEMMKAIEAALIHTRLSDEERLAADRTDAIRIVCFLTDGYVGNDMAIVDAIRKHADITSVFSFGIGNSVNRFLIEGMAQAGRGEAEVITLAGDADAAVTRLHERVLAPVLTDIEIDWGNLPVSEILPQQIPDLYTAKPICVHGRLDGPATGNIVLRGWTGSGRYEEQITIDWPTEPPDHDALASLWARAKVADLMMQDYAGLQNQSFPADLKQQIIDLGLTYNLLTQFTSFVAVEELTITSEGEPLKINVPVEMPDGVSYEGVFGVPQSRLSRVNSAHYGRFAAGVPRRGKASAHVAADPGAPPPNQQITMDELKPDATAAREGDEFRGLIKLAEPLRGLAERVAKDGTDGTLEVDGLKVVNYRVKVLVYFTGDANAARATLEKLGFKTSGETRAAKVLVGSIDVRKLVELAKLQVVTVIKPLPGGN